MISHLLIFLFDINLNQARAELRLLRLERRRTSAFVDSAGGGAGAATAGYSGADHSRLAPWSGT